MKSPAMIATFLICVGTQLYAADGLLLVEKTTNANGTETNQIQIESKRMRAENSGVGGDKQAFIFDSTKQVMWIVNYTRKTYTEINKEDVDRMGAQMSDAMSRMQQQMANLPPEQRAQIEAMMKGRGMAAMGAPAKTEYKKTGTDKVGKWTCDKYEGYRNNQKVSELCTVEPQALGFTTADFEIARQLQSFFSKVIPQGAAENMFRVGSMQDQGFSGVPVRRVSTDGQSTSEIVDSKRQSFGDDLFTVPAGFEKQAMPFGGRGRGRGL